MTETKKKKEKFYTLRHDKAVKTVLINEKYKPVVSKILSDILEEPVTILEFLLNELPSNNFHSKSNRLDVIAKLTDGTLINIEVNSSYSRYVKLRNLLFYTAMYSQLVEVGNDNYSEVKTIQVNLNFEMGDNKGLKRRSKIRYEDTNEIYDDSFEIIDVNIDKYKKLWYHENINGDLSHLYLVMLGADKDELLELGKQDETVKEIADTMIKLNKDGTFTRLISEEEEEKFFHNLEVNAARKEGKEEGLLEGEQKGALEEKRNIVRTLLAKKYKIEEIIDITGLTEEEILEIQENTDTETK